MDILPTLPVAETASESLAPSSTVSLLEVEALGGVGHTARRLRLRCANREDVLRVPARLENLIAPNHSARQIWETVKGLDLSEFYAAIQVEDGTPGAPATDPLILIALWVYATSQGETCARAVADLCVNHLAYIWLCGGVSMNYHTLCDFRTQYEAALDQLMTQGMRRLRDAGWPSTDAEARVMKMADGGFRPAYNWEFVGDTARLVITGVEVINAGSDKAQTLPMLAEDQRRSGRLPHDWLMDGGFVTLSVIEAAEVDRHVRVLAPVPEPKDETRDRYTPLPSDSPAVAAWRQRMGTAEAKDTYKLRAATVECVNAHARTRYGVYQVRVRGRVKVRCVALWVALTHNLLIWIREAPPSPPGLGGVSGAGAGACQGALRGLVGGTHAQLAHLDSRRARANATRLPGTVRQPGLTKQGASQTGDKRS